MTQVVVAPLTLDAARILTDEVKADAAALWAKLLQLYEGKAHIALSYSSWGEYYEEEFGGRKSHGYRLLDSARVIDALPENRSPMGERVARELVPVLRSDPEQVAEVWGEVVEEHGVQPTAVQVKEVVARHAPAEPNPEPEPEQLLRAELISWFAQGRVVMRLLDDGATFESLPERDCVSLCSDVDLMARIAAQIKGALSR